MKLLLFVAMLVTALTVHAADTMASWRKKSGMYITKRSIPAGSEVRIKVVEVGERADLKLKEYVGASNLIARSYQTWESEDLRSGQVLKVRLSKGMTVGVAVGGSNYARNPKKLKAGNGFHEMRFVGGWIVQVKVIGEDF